MDAQLLPCYTRKATSHREEPSIFNICYMTALLSVRWRQAGAIRKLAEQRSVSLNLSYLKPSVIRDDFDAGYAVSPSIKMIEVSHIGTRPLSGLSSHNNEAGACVNLG